MNQFSGLERRLANMLSAFPGVKKAVKKLYQRLVFMFSRSKSNYSCIQVLREFEDSGETFFGYYDKSPLNKKSRYVLYHRTHYPTSRLPDPAHPVDIVIYDLAGSRELFHLRSTAYNWQQGSRLHWLDGDRFIFNDFEDGDYVSRIGSVSSRGIDSIIGFPVYDTCGNTALSLNFERLNLLRPDYGYRNKGKFTKEDLLKLENDGIFRVDLEKNKQELIISLGELAVYELNNLPVDTLHKVNHLMISPAADKFVFLHRYYVRGRKFDRLILAGMDGKLSGVLSDQQMISHYCWLDNEVLLAYMRQFETGDQYYLLNTGTRETRILNGSVLAKYGDGHPSIHSGMMLFDTYPNRARMKELLIYDLESRELLKLGDFYESFRYYGETRCDLHPRWSADGRHIFLDSVHTGHRKLYMIELKDQLSG